MVGKGSVSSSSNPTGSYAYIVGCDPTADANAPFELRYGSQRFRLTSTSNVVCWNDPDARHAGDGHGRVDVRRRRRRRGQGLGSDHDQEPVGTTVFFGAA